MEYDTPRSLVNVQFRLVGWGPIAACLHVAVPVSSHYLACQRWRNWTAAGARRCVYDRYVAFHIASLYWEPRIVVHFYIMYDRSWLIGTLRQMLLHMEFLDTKVRHSTLLLLMSCHCGCMQVIRCSRRYYQPFNLQTSLTTLVSCKRCLTGNLCSQSLYRTLQLPYQLFVKLCSQSLYRTLQLSYQLFVKLCSQSLHRTLQRK